MYSIVTDSQSSVDGLSRVRVESQASSTLALAAMYWVPTVFTNGVG